MTVGYSPFGSLLGHQARLLKVINTTNAGMFLSFDGTTDNDYVPANGFTLYDFTTNSTNTGSFVIQRNTQIYLKYETLPTLGNVYLVNIYSKGE